MLPNGTEKILCQSLVQSHLDYAVSSWCAAMTQKAKNKLQIIQNNMIRFILDLEPRTHLTTEHMAELNILKIPDRVKQLKLSTAHKIYHNQAPTYLEANFNKLGTGHSIPLAVNGTLLYQMSSGQKQTHPVAMQ